MAAPDRTHIKSTLPTNLTCNINKQVNSKMQFHKWVDFTWLYLDVINLNLSESNWSIIIIVLSAKQWFVWLQIVQSWFEHRLSYCSLCCALGLYAVKRCPNSHSHLALKTQQNKWVQIIIYQQIAMLTQPTMNGVLNPMTEDVGTVLVTSFYRNWNISSSGCN